MNPLVIKVFKINGDKKVNVFSIVYETYTNERMPTCCNNRYHSMEN